MTINRSGKMQ